MHQPNDVEFATVHLATGPRLHYAEQGYPAREAIVFLHAYADSWFSYGRVLPLLSSEYHALAPDQRGHGDSDKPQCCYTADDYAADVDAFMEAVGIEKATLVGDSSGGMIAPARCCRPTYRGAWSTPLRSSPSCGPSREKRRIGARAEAGPWRR